MHGRRVFLAKMGARFGAALVLAPALAPTFAHARRPKRPDFWVQVHANHPLEASLGDDIDAPPEAVVRALRQVGDWAQWVPMFSRSDVVEQTGGHTTFDGALDLPWPVRDRSFRANARPQGKREVSLERVAGFGNMGNFDVTLTVADLGNGRSRVSAQAEIDFGLRLSKAFIEWLARIKGPQLFEALELRAKV